MPTVPIKKLPDAYQRHAERGRAAVIRAQRSACHAGKVIVKRATPKDRGLAQNSWQANMGPKNARPPTPAAWLSNSAPYIGILEKGARPHKVSLDGQRSIYEWVERHFRLVGHGGGVMSAGEIPEGVSSNSLTATKSRRHKVARQGYLDKLTRLGAMLENNLVRNFPDMGRKLVPAALNIAAAIIQKIRTKGAKPRFFVRMSLPILLQILQDETKRHIADIAKRGK